MLSTITKELMINYKIFCILTELWPYKINDIVSRITMATI